MKNEGFQHTLETQQEHELIEVREYREGATLYIFNNLGVIVDITGRNYKPLPELFFGPYDNEKNTGSLSQPNERDDAVDMKYVSRCIQKVANETGVHKFWFYPFGGDVVEEKKEGREKARLRLFIKHSPNIKPAPEGHGYILTV